MGGINLSWECAQYREYKTLEYEPAYRHFDVQEVPLGGTYFSVSIKYHRAIVDALVQTESLLECLIYLCLIPRKRL